MEKRTALITGATGLVGRELVDVILASDHYDKIKILTRRELPIKDNRIEEIVMNLDDMEDRKADLGANDYYCCLGTTMRKAGSKENFIKIDHDYPLTLAKIAMEFPEFDQYLIVTAVGANSSSPLFYNEVKGKIEDSLKDLGMKKLHIFQPSLLLGAREDFRILEELAKLFSSILTFFVIGSKKKLWSIKGSEVAKAMLKVAMRDGDGTKTYKPFKIRSLVG